VLERREKTEAIDILHAHCSRYEEVINF